MYIVNKTNGEIFYKGLNTDDCENHMPEDKDDYIIIPAEEYDDFVDYLVAGEETLDEMGG